MAIVYKLLLSYLLMAKLNWCRMDYVKNVCKDKGEGSRQCKVAKEKFKKHCK